MTKTAHVHSMVPNRPVAPSFYRCTSCGFRCTIESVKFVKNNPSKHRVTPASAPIWSI